MNKLCIVDSGEALQNGIGAMSVARFKDLHDKLVKTGLFKAGEVHLAQVTTTQLVNEKVGMDVKTRLGGE